MTISIKNLSIHLHNQCLVEPISFDIQKGQCLSIVGESGAGKSLISMSLLNLLPPPLQKKGDGIFLNDQDISNYSEEKMQSMEDELAPFGFIGSADEDDSFVDSSGQVWFTVNDH